VSFEWVYNLGDAKKPDWKVVQDQSNEQLSVKTHRNGKTVSVVFTNTGETLNNPRGFGH